MLKLKKQIVTAGLILASFAVYSQDAKDNEQSVTLTVDQAVDYALKNSRTLKTADIDLEIKKRAGDNAWNVLLPNVQVSGTLARSNDVSSTLDQINKSLPAGYKLSETEKMHWAIVGNIGVSWNFSMAYIQQIKASKADYEAGKITHEQSIKETKTNVQKLFYGLLLQQESLSIQKNTLSNARQRAEQAETNYKNGLVPELSLLQAQVTYENMRPDVRKAERELNQQLDTFAFLLGLPVGTEVKLTGTISTEYVEANYEKLIEQYGNSSLDIKSLEKNIEILELNCSALKLSAYTPALALSWGYQPTGSGFDDFKNFNDKGTLSLTVAWNLTNILPWSSTQQQIKTLNANLEKLQISREMLLENKRIEVRKACNTLQEAREQITNMGRNIELAERSYYSTLKAYKNGTRELLDLRDAENQLNQAKLGLAAQKFNYISALLDLENTLDISLTKKTTETK